MVHAERYKKSSPRFSFAKSFTLYLVFLALGCSQKTKNSTEELKVFSSEEEGVVHQLTSLGENTEPYFSALNNKILFVRRFSKMDIPGQIFEKNLVDKKERRLTYNIGNNINPEYHPFKQWFIYAGSGDEKAEDHAIYCEVLKKYLTKNTKDKDSCDIEPFEIYISSDDNASFKRITRQKGPDVLPTFSKDGSGFYYVQETESKHNIYFFNISTGKQKIIHSSDEKIWDLSTNSLFLAFVEGTENKKSLKVLSLKTLQLYWSLNDKNISHIQLNAKNNNALISGKISDNQNDIYLLDLDKKCHSRLTHEGSDDIQPTFGPAGSTYFFSSDRNETYQIYSAVIKQNLSCTPLE